MIKQHRYPGSKPFTSDQRDIFFGRERDISNLSEMIKVENLIVIYGKSGLGKSSLINAGVVPELKSSGECEVFSVRLGSYQDDVEDYHTPVNKLLWAVRVDRKKESFLRKIYRNTHSLWGSLKGLQIAENLDKEIVIIIDQFEELFTYPDREVREFKEQLAEVLSGKLPHDLRLSLKEKMEDNPEILSKDEMNVLYKSMKVKLVLAIRSDRMSLLNRMRNYIPNILQKVYEVRPLTPLQAEDAILSPASLTDPYNEFESPQFDYDDEALDKILNFLTKSNEKEVESFQLQILCQYVEENIVIATNDVSISPEDLGDMEEIYQNYYDHQIEKLSSEHERLKARKLLEEDLIFAEEQRRLSLYEGQIYSKGLTNDLLTRLVNTHLLRAEPHPSGGFSYEISHDTLVNPILKSKERRNEEESKKRAEEVYKKKRRRRIILFLSIVLGVVLAILIGQYIIISQEAIQNLKKYQQEKIEKEKITDRYNKIKDSQIATAIQENDSLKRLLANKQVALDNSLRKTVSLQDTVNHLHNTINKALKGTPNGITTSKSEILRSENIQLRNQVSSLKKMLTGEHNSNYYTLKKLNKELEEAIYLIVDDKQYQPIKKGIFAKYKDYEETLRKKSLSKP